MVAENETASSQIKQLRKATTQELAGLLEKVEVVHTQPPELDSEGKPLIRLDDYGHPKHVKMVPDKAIVYSARLGLKQTYWDWSRKPEERQEAGEALGYSSFRIELHEKARPIRKALKRFSESLHRPYDQVVFGFGRELINTKS